MVQESVPQSVAADDNLRIVAVPGASNAKSVAILAAITTKDVTYSLKVFNRSISEAVIDDPRLTLKQVLQRAGRITETLEIQYVFGSEDDVAAVVFTEGTELSIAARYAVPNATAWEVGQKVDILHVTCGKQRKDAPTENGVWTITQTLFVTGVSEDDALLVA